MDKNRPNIFNLKSLIRHCETTQSNCNGKWVPARPVSAPTLKERFHRAYLVFTGKADALIWPEGQ